MNEEREDATDVVVVVRETTVKVELVDELVATVTVDVLVPVLAVAVIVVAPERFVSLKRTILLAEFSVTQISPELPWLMPKGALMAVGTRNSVNCPENGSREPKPFAVCSVNQTLAPSSMATFNSPAPVVGGAYSRKYPEEGGPLSPNNPSLLVALSINQTRPSALQRGVAIGGLHSATMLPGFVDTPGIRNSKIVPVLEST